MSNRIKYKDFVYSFIGTIFICIVIALYCIVNGQAMASTHLEPQYSIATLQIIIADIAAVIFAIVKRTRKWFWFSIPSMLVLFAILYVNIVNQYPCCTGG